MGPACFPPRLTVCPRLAGAMQLGPRPATLGLLLLCAAAASAGEAEELHYRQGEHRADYDREALLGGQVRRPDRGLGGPGLAARLPRALSPRDKGGGRARPGRGSLTMGAGRGAAHSPMDPGVCKLVKIVRPKTQIPSTLLQGAGSLRGSLGAGPLESRYGSPQKPSARKVSNSSVFLHHFTLLIVMLDPPCISLTSQRKKSMNMLNSPPKSNTKD